MRARSNSASAGFEGLTQLRTTLFETGNADATRSAARAVSTGWAATAQIISRRHVDDPASVSTEALLEAVVTDRHLAAVEPSADQAVVELSVLPGATACGAEPARLLAATAINEGLVLARGTVRYRVLAAVGDCLVQRDSEDFARVLMRCVLGAGCITAEEEAGTVIDRRRFLAAAGADDDGGGGLLCLDGVANLAPALANEGVQLADGLAQGLDVVGGDGVVGGTLDLIGDEVEGEAERTRCHDLDRGLGVDDGKVLDAIPLLAQQRQRLLLAPRQLDADVAQPLERLRGSDAVEVARGVLQFVGGVDVVEQQLPILLPQALFDQQLDARGEMKDGVLQAARRVELELFDRRGEKVEGILEQGEVEVTVLPSAHAVTVAWLRQGEPRAWRNGAV